jgi:small-conductance mechanosensitive channel
MMKARQWGVILGLTALVTVTLAGLYLTSGRPSTPASKAAAVAAARGSGSSLVDQRPLQMARQVAALARTQDEKRYASEVLRLADHEVDLTFTDALRDAAEHPPQLSAEAKAIDARISKAEDTLKVDQATLARLTKELGAANDKNRDNIQQQIDITKAQQELDQDELDDAKADLARAGGDKKDRLQRLLDEHEATQHENPIPAASGTNSELGTGSFAEQFRTWLQLRNQQKQLTAARQASIDAAADLGRTHDTLEARLGAEKPTQQTISQQAVENSKSSTAETAAEAKQKAAAAVSSLQRLSSDQKNLSDLDKRIQDHQELSENYGTWMILVAGYQQTAAHGLLQGALLILLVVLVVYLTNRMVDRFFSDPASQNRRLVTIRAVVRFAVQAIGVLLILFVIFGIPNQMPTMLGLAGAGLTVALKDFIVAFFGWFVLMGRNGIRVGDWVEINGVAGEVVEIGLLRTVLMETGNWADSGHPTGRRVAFVNSFAIEGHFFNFSTAGQWLWDELQVMIPTGKNPYPLLEAVRDLVTKTTEKNAHLAEEEWRRAAGPNRVKSFSAAPAINLRPTGSGIEMHVRYIVQAHERYAVRTDLYQAVIELLHTKGEVAQQAQGS